MRRRAALAFLVTACSAGAPTPVNDAAVAADTAPSDAQVDGAGRFDGSSGAPDVAVETSTPADGADTRSIPATPCAQACLKWQGCMPLDACLTACQFDSCAEQCVAAPSVKTCEDAADCLGLWKDAKPFSPGPYGTKWRTLAGDVKVPTEQGEFSLADHWNGRNVFIFLTTQDGFAYADKLWKSNLKQWLQASPKNVHYVFFALAGKDPVAAQALVDKQRDAVIAQLAKLSEYEQCLWGRRVHFASSIAQKFGGPLSDVIKSVGGQAAIGVDRAQQWRQIGLLQTVGGAPELRLLTYEPRYWNWEVVRQAELASYPELAVPVHKASDGSHFDVEVELPPASQLADYDTLLIDLGGWCKDHKDENCAEWDYIASAALCERPLQPVPQQKCQPGVPDVAEVKEVIGLCGDTTATCKLAADCSPTADCKGYVAPVAAKKGSPPEQANCTCSNLDGTPIAHNSPCKGDGSGFQPCPCGCSLEFGRWITTYHREGRWVSDVTPSLVYFKAGGKHRIKFDAANIPMVDFTLRFQKRGSPLRPKKLIDLFGGGPFYQDYNKKYKPLTVDIPASTKKVELYALITGHGFGTELDNCAEFCNHTHHFGINGKEFVHSHPVAGTFMGCAEAVDVDGVIPNQFGTWTLGRGGWCPGQHVKPYRIDVTAALTKGGSNTLTYKGLFNGSDYVPKPNPKPQGGFGASINKRSWLVLYE